MSEATMSQSTEGARGGRYLTLADWARRMPALPLTEPLANAEFAMFIKDLDWDEDVMHGRSGAIYTGREMG